MRRILPHSPDAAATVEDNRVGVVELMVSQHSRPRPSLVGHHVPSDSPSVVRIADPERHIG